MEVRSSELNADLSARMRRIEGQVRGVQRMIEEGRECPDILQQMTAIRSAVHQASLLLARAYMAKYLQEPATDDPETALDRVMTTLSKLDWAEDYRIDRRDQVNLFKRSKEVQQETPAESANKVEPLHVTGEEFERVVLGSEIPAVVDFWAEWCGPCHAIAPAVTQLATEYEGRALVAKVNADDYPEILMNYGIMGIPTLLYFKGGEVVDRVVGVNSYNNLKNKLEKVLA